MWNTAFCGQLVKTQAGRGLKKQKKGCNWNCVCGSVWRFVPCLEPVWSELGPVFGVYLVSRVAALWRVQSNTSVLSWENKHNASSSKPHWNSPEDTEKAQIIYQTIDIININTCYKLVYITLKASEEPLMEICCLKCLSNRHHNVATLHQESFIHMLYIYS